MKIMLAAVSPLDPIEAGEDHAGRKMVPGTNLDKWCLAPISKVLKLLGP
jgi:hypothetical protein